MFQSLKIQNYALIDHVDIKFDTGFITITGETGAGKSILIGALSLILGNRADTSLLKDEKRKCIVEASFNVEKYNLQHIFEYHDLDYDKETIIRREINSNGKSRAFVNDTPVNIKVLKDLGNYLVDIHSQHQNLILKDNTFHLNVIDAYADQKELIKNYKDLYTEFRKTEKEYHQLKSKAEQSKADLDYYQFQYDQLEKANLSEEEQEELENELEILNHAEEIKYNLSRALHLLTNDEGSVLTQMREADDSLKKIVDFFPKVKKLSERVESSYIEIQDIANELDVLNQDIEYDPQRLEFIQERLDEIYSLQHKHHVNTVSELIKIKKDLEKQIEEIDSMDFRLEEINNELEERKEQLTQLSDKLSESRKKVIPSIEQHITNMLVELGIPNATFNVGYENTEEFTPNGRDRIQFLFSANKNFSPEDISKVASGGELSRVMLSLKSLIAESTSLPTIIFDEIDSGTSGEIADKMGTIMKKMSRRIQVLNITHLPQIASKGDSQYLVYKEDHEDKTHTNIRKLNNEERIKEIAKMLSGEQLTDTALQNAKEFLKTS
ncbi:MAG: DNA repair protein RecN [Bacteroidales bacterium]